MAYNGAAYISLQSSNTNHQPDTSPTFWSLLAQGIEPYSAVAHQWINAVGSNGAPSSTQPAFSDISGTVSPSQLPTPTATTLGGVKSQAAIAHQWINGIDTTGSPSTSQPADSDLNVSDNSVNNVSTAAHGFAPKAPASTGQWLRGDATWANAPGRLASFTVLTTAGAGTYTTPANITAILVECVGGGGGGGGAAGALITGAAAGGSGGSGSYSRKYVAAPLSSYGVTIGAAGNGGGTSGTAGTAGGSTTLGAVVSCNGGAAGAGGASSTIAGSITLGGGGGAASSTGDLNSGGSAWRVMGSLWREPLQRPRLAGPLTSGWWQPESSLPTVTPHRTTARAEAGARRKEQPDTPAATGARAFLSFGNFSVDPERSTLFVLRLVNASRKRRQASCARARSSSQSVLSSVDAASKAWLARSDVTAPLRATDVRRNVFRSPAWMAAWISASNVKASLV